jgi:hypothetical protein
MEMIIPVMAVFKNKIDRLTGKDGYYLMIIADMSYLVW